MPGDRPRAAGCDLGSFAGTQSAEGKDALRQLWTYQDGGFIRNAASGLVLDYETGNTRKLGVVHVCVYPQKAGADAHNQRWLARRGGLIAAADDIGRVLDIRVRRRLLELFLSTQGDRKDAGSEILLYKLKPGQDETVLNQRWTFEVRGQFRELADASGPSRRSGPRVTCQCDASTFLASARRSVARLCWYVQCCPLLRCSRAQSTRRRVRVSA